MTPTIALTTDIHDGIMTITINRPDKLNALNDEVLGLLADALEELGKNDNVKAAIITGAGEKAFVAGADIAGFLQAPSTDGYELAKKGQTVFQKIEHHSKPIMAAVNGFALGGGCELAMSCHFRIASENARFGQPEINLGIIPGYGGTQRLPRLIGKGRAMEMMMTGEHISAEEAYRIGLVNQVCKQEELLNIACAKAQLIISKPSRALKNIIAAANASDGEPSTGFEAEARLFGDCFASDDMKEGVTAFLEKRKPHFNKN